MTPIIARVVSTAIIGLAAFAWMQPLPATASDPTGTWRTEDGRARVRTEHCGPEGENLCGFVVWLQKPLDEAGKPRVDTHNPDAGKQARPVLGHQMLLGLRPNWEGRHAGKIYSGDHGKYYDVTV